MLGLVEDFFKLKDVGCTKDGIDWVKAESKARTETTVEAAAKTVVKASAGRSVGKKRVIKTKGAGRAAEVA